MIAACVGKRLNAFNVELFFLSFFLCRLQIQRLASYERYFQDLLSETAADHPDLDEVHKARDKAQEVCLYTVFFSFYFVRKGEEEEPCTFY